MYSICPDKDMKVEQPIEECPPPPTDKEILEQMKMSSALQPRGPRVMRLVPM